MENQNKCVLMKVVLGSQIIIGYMPNFECAWYFFVSVTPIHPGQADLMRVCIGFLMHAVRVQL